MPLAMRFIRTSGLAEMRALTVLFLVLVAAGKVTAADISDPTKFMFVGDRVDNVIDVLSLDDPEVFRPQMIVFNSRAPSWDLMDPDLPSFEGMPPQADMPEM